MEASSATLVKTVLHAEHSRLEARFGPFAGWNMPIRYPAGILAEHHHTRAATSLFDICHMGEFHLEGANVAEALDGLFARGTADQPVGSCRYNLLLAEDGGVLDDLILYRMTETAFFIVVNAGTRDRDAQTIQARLPANIAFEDRSDAIGKIDLQGPKSAEVLASFGLEPAALPRRFRWARAALAGIDVTLSRTGYTGELGFEIYVPADRTPVLWRALVDHETVEPAGLGARDTLRLEVGLPLYGHELDEQTTPLEAGLDWVVRPKEREFIGRACLDSAPAKHLVGFVLDGRRAARQGDTVFTTEGETVGTVTSGCFAPSVGSAVAFAFVQAGTSFAEGEEFHLGRTVKRALPARVSPVPFYTEGSGRVSL